MGKVHHLTSPFSEEVIRSLHAGDTVYFDGPLFGIRDLTQIHIFDHNNPPPVSLEGRPCIHTAPSLRKVGDKWEKICGGTTTSTRMDRFTPGLIGQLRTGVEPTAAQFQAFHDRLYAATSARIPDRRALLFRMKEAWRYLGCSFADAERPLRRIRKAQAMIEYESAVRQLSASCPVRETAGYFV